MKLPSHPRGSREGRSRERRGSTSPATATDRTAVRKPLASFVSSSSSSSSAFSSHSGASAADASGGRVTEVPRERGPRTKRKGGAEKRDKSTRSKKSRKKKHRKKKHRVSSSSSSSSASSRSPSRSPSRFRPSSWTDQSPRRSPAASSSSVCQGGGLHNQKVTGWDVGPQVLEGRKLPAGAQHWTSHCGDSGVFSSSSSKEKATLHEEQEKCQQHDPKTYAKAFGVAIPSGQYAFVSEETDLAVFLPGAGRGQATTSLAGVGTLSSSPTGTSPAGGNDSASGGRVCAGPPALGVLRLLKEANEAEKGRQAGTCESSAEGWKKNSARGASKVTSKTHPHLFWQCWNCSADNYKTRHQCYRCNRLYMQ